MRIKKIELIGFKSFADRTEIHLDPGVTCVVGPNGCGKSNISDALRWVFGERSAKLLRGTRMEDVIFNGTEFRKPMGMAEVSLYLDNEDHKLGLPYEEIVLTRRLDRSGQSQYFINKTACRLKDIIDLILDTGMGSNSYSMIEQGRVDAIVNSDPQERRFLIEEAAGISKYKVKKEEAIRKLEKTEENLLRIRDILAEVQKNIQYAEKQAKRAERYRVQFEELKTLEIQKAFIDLSQLHLHKNTQDAKRRELTATLEKLELGFRELAKKEEEQKIVLQQILDEESKKTNTFYELRSESGSLKQKYEFNTERLTQTRKRQIEIGKEQELLLQQLSGLEEEIKGKGLEREREEEKRETIGSAFLEKKENFNQIETRYKETRAEAEGCKIAAFENASRSAQSRNELHRVRSLIDRTFAEQNKIKEVQAKLSKEKEIFEKRRIDYQKELHLLSEEWRGGNLQKETSKKSFDELKIKITALEGTINEKRLKLQEISSRMKLLEELHETAEESEQKLMASLSPSRLRGKFVRTLRDTLEIKPGYEAAVETLLGIFAQGLIAEDVETARKLMAEMSQIHMGPCGIFIQNLVLPPLKEEAKEIPLHPKIQHPVEEVVKIHQGFESLLRPLFHHAYVVEDFSPEDLESLLPLSQKARLVTKQGIVLGPHARVFFRNGRLTPHLGPFERQAERRGLKEKHGSLQREIDGCENEKTKLRDECQGLETFLESAEERQRDDYIRKEALESLLSGLNERLASLDEEARILVVEKEEGLAEEKRLTPLIQDLESSLERFETQGQALTAQQKQTEESLQILQTEREQKIQELSRLQTLLENHEEKLRMISANHDLLRKQADSGKERLGRLETETSELNRRHDGIQSEQTALEENRAAADLKQRGIEEELSNIRGQRSFHDEKFRQIQAERQKAEQETAALQNSLHQQDLLEMDLSYKERTILERIDHTYHVKLAELSREDFATEASEQEIEEQIGALKERVEAFGAVNLLAEEEYRELKERHEFLATQEKDLNEARESLLKAIREINRTTKTLFSDTFARAQTLFQEYYQILFRGGHAELILTETEESEEAGIEIMVRPPGKKLQHISLLSGGEKALTGIALLFALFRIKPSPLCVLDEVDAPLDEANVDRFLGVLKTFLEFTQFIIVTHNRKTISIGDYLYGVTMEESGVSKLVSVKVAATQEKQEKAAVTV